MALIISCLDPRKVTITNHPLVHAANAAYHWHDGPNQSMQQTQTIIGMDGP